MYLGTKTWRIVAGAAALTLLLGACGDDDEAADTTTTEAEEETTTTTEAAEAGGDGVNPEFAAYCGAVAELDAQEETPSAEQLEALRDVAPAEISAEVDTVVEILLAGIASGDVETAFNDPALAEAFEPIEAFETENCGAGEDEGATGEVNPEFADYCELAIELDAQEDFASEEQLNEILAAAPEEIRAEAEIVVAGFLEAYAAGTPEAAFENPDVIENLGAIEAFDAENCGIDN